LVVKAYIAPCDGEAEGFAGQFEAFYRFYKLPIDFWDLRTAEVEAVGHA
jgi:hypothetical protein